MLKRLNKNCLRLVRFILRRERIMSVIWLVSLIGITVMVAIAFQEMYATDADRLGMAMTMENPAMIAMCGPVYGIRDYHIGAMMGNEMLLFTILAVAIMNIFLVVRHTRRDEERGRIEVIRSLPVGRLSNLSATMLVSVLVNGALALLTGISLAVLGIESLDWNGSMLYGAALGVCGLFFAALTALFAQLSSNARGATGLSFGALGILYMLRAVGDISNETLARISPLGLILRVQVYVKNYWWPVWLVLLITAVIMAAAFFLNSIRDAEQGFLPARPGREHASSYLQSPVGLSLRLLSGSCITWMIGVFVLGAAYGSVLGDLESFIEGNDLLKQMFPPDSSYSLTELFITMLMSVMAMLATVPVLSFILKLRSEEKRNHTEQILSRSVSRTRLMSGYFMIAFLGSLFMLFLSVLGLWAASSFVMAEPIAFASLLKAMMVYLPAVWVMLGLAVLFIGILPEWTGFTWIYLGFSFFAVYLGGILQLPEWLKKLSPFGNIPQLPVDEINYPTLLVMTVLAIILSIIGFVFYRKRDIQG